MATIKSQLVLSDGMSAVLKKINNALNLTLNSFEQVQRASGAAIDNAAISEARAGLVEANRALAEMEEHFSSAAKEEEKLNNSIHAGTSAADGLLKKITSIAATYASISTAKGLIADSLNAADIQLDAQVQLNTVMGNMGTLDYYDDVLNKASAIQSKGIYGDEAMIAGAAELSTYFSDGEAILSMMDTLSNYAMGMSGGGELDSKAMVDYATGIGKIMTGSYDAMSKKGFEFSDAQKAIIEGTATNAQIVETLGEEYVGLSNDMQAAAVIGAVIEENWAGLYETMSNTPHGKIIQLKNAFVGVKKEIGVGIYPAVLGFINLVMDNLPQIESIALGIATVISTIINFVSLVIKTLLPITSLVGNISGAFNTLKPAIAAVAVVAAGLGLIMVASAMKSIAAWALMHIPLVLLIACVVALCAAAMKMGSTFQEVCGAIGGIFGVLFSVLYNTFIVPFWNGFAMIANFLANAFNDPIAAVKVAFYDMCLTVIGYIRSIADSIETLLNKIPGVSVNITSGIDNLYSKLEKAQQSVKDKSGWIEVVSKLDYMDANNAWNAGYDFGSGFADTLEGIFDTSRLGSMEDYTKDSLGVGGIGGDVSDISDNTAASAESQSMTEEQLKYLHDIAERDAINRFTTAEVKIDMTGMTNKIDSSQDLDGVITRLTDGFTEALITASEGVHA